MTNPQPQTTQDNEYYTVSVKINELQVLIAPYVTPRNQPKFKKELEAHVLKKQLSYGNDFEFELEDLINRNYREAGKRMLNYIRLKNAQTERQLSTSTGENDELNTMKDASWHQGEIMSDLFEQLLDKYRVRSKTEVARQLGISKSYFSKLMSGDKPVTDKIKERALLLLDPAQSQSNNQQSI